MKKILFIIITVIVANSCDFFLALSIAMDESAKREREQYQVAIAINNTEIGPCALVLNDCMGYEHDTLFIKQSSERYMIFSADTCQGPNGLFKLYCPTFATEESYMEVYKYLKENELDKSPYKVWKPNQKGFFTYPDDEWKFWVSRTDDLTTYLYVYQIL